MKSKLTLSLPEKTISEAKQIAKLRRTTVSALFAESLLQWRFDTHNGLGTAMEPPQDMADLLGVFQAQPPFDARSSAIREKHG
jgi:hypothetical protein